jgi:hypothetical protein
VIQFQTIRHGSALLPLLVGVALTACSRTEPATLNVSLSSVPADPQDLFRTSFAKLMSKRATLRGLAAEVVGEDKLPWKRRGSRWHFVPAGVQR